ncbi:MAG: hypothetical protein ISS70_26980 [Phycisphaerae bacterium]|nr:hypothetical protein [Phycisphaerae bacterium]
MREDVPVVALTEVVEGAIAAVFKHLKYEIIYDIDEPECPRPWRKWVVAALEEVQAEVIPAPNCTDTREWGFQLEQLSDRILWDTDYEDAELYIDFPPEKSRELRDWDDIPDNYYTAIADDLTDEEAKAKIKELRKLCDSVIESYRSC